MPGYFDLNNRLALVTGASRGLEVAGFSVQDRPQAVVKRQNTCAS